MKLQPEEFLFILNEAAKGEPFVYWGIYHIRRVDLGTIPIDEILSLFNQCRLDDIVFHLCSHEESLKFKNHKIAVENHFFLKKHIYHEFDQLKITITFDLTFPTVPEKNVKGTLKLHGIESIQLAKEMREQLREPQPGRMMVLKEKKAVCNIL